LNEYELLYILTPRVPADDVANAIERVSAIITTQGGEVLSTDNWGRRRLAYPIRQYFEGTYVLITLKMPPAGARAGGRPAPRGRGHPPPADRRDRPAYQRRPPARGA